MRPYFDLTDRSHSRRAESLPANLLASACEMTINDNPSTKNPTQLQTEVVTDGDTTPSASSAYLKEPSAAPRRDDDDPRRSAAPPTRHESDHLCTVDDIKYSSIPPTLSDGKTYHLSKEIVGVNRLAPATRGPSATPAALAPALPAAGEPSHRRPGEAPHRADRAERNGHRHPSSDRSASARTSARARRGPLVESGKFRPRPVCPGTNCLRRHARRPIEPCRVRHQHRRPGPQRPAPWPARAPV